MAIARPDSPNCSRTQYRTQGQDAGAKFLPLWLQKEEPHEETGAWRGLSCSNQNPRPDCRSLVGDKVHTEPRLSTTKLLWLLGTYHVPLWSSAGPSVSQDMGHGLWNTAFQTVCLGQTLRTRQDVPQGEPLLLLFSAKALRRKPTRPTLPQQPGLP